MGYALEKNEFILFLGDSITDTGRSYLLKESLGEGYPHLVSEQLREELPDHNIQCLNKGISGNRIYDLKKRFHRDCIGLYPFPTIVSVYIGINDTWRVFDMGLSSPPERFESTYRELLDRIQSRSSFTRLILLSPFVLEDCEEKKEWRADVDERRAVVNRLAQDYGARYIDLQPVFEQAMASSGKGPLHYTVDGVHPTPEGHRLIARQWLGAFEASK